MQENFSYKSPFRLPKNLILLLSLIFCSLSHGLENISFGNVLFADNRIQLTPKNFTAQSSLPPEIDTSIKILNNTFEWIRTSDILAMPRARVRIDLQVPEEKLANYHFSYKGKSLSFQTLDSGLQAEIYYSLFEKDKIDVFEDGHFIGSFSFMANKTTKKKHYIDYSCSRFKIKLTGLDNELLSMGCKKIKMGKFGEEENLIEVHWISPNLKLLDLSSPPYILSLNNSSTSNIKLISESKEIVNLNLKATIPNRSHRLNIAYGLGPYAFETEYNSSKKQNSIGIDQPIAPAIMLYFNFNMTQKSSIRGFNAFIVQESVFNNLGIYYASDIASLLDNKLKITTLLGVQHLYFKFNNNAEAIAEPIAPQGIEFTYNHAFDIENYIISGGAFLSPSDSIDYQNIWIRWGKGVFWELNYIYWADQGFSAKTWGLSAGFFFGGYL